MINPKMAYMLGVKGDLTPIDEETIDLIAVAKPEAIINRDEGWVCAEGMYYHFGDAYLVQLDGVNVNFFVTAKECKDLFLIGDGSPSSTRKYAHAVYNHARNAKLGSEPTLRDLGRMYEVVRTAKQEIERISRYGGVPTHTNEDRMR